jgi:hypothetical protein
MASTKSFGKQIISLFAGANNEAINKICADNKHNINVILKTYKKYCINKVIGAKSHIVATKEKPITMNSYIESQICIHFNSDVGDISIELDIEEFTEIAKQFPGITLDCYNKLSDEDKESICAQTTIKELYLHLQTLKFKPAQIKAILVRIANHINVKINPENMIENNASASACASASASNHKPKPKSKSKTTSPAPKRKGLNKLRSFQAYITKEGFFNEVIDDEDITLIRKFIEGIPGDNIVKMTNIWKTLSPEDKGLIDEFYSSFPEIEDSVSKIEKSKIASKFFLENAPGAIELFKKVCIKEEISAIPVIPAIPAIPVEVSKQTKTPKPTIAPETNKIVLGTKKASPFAKPAPKGKGKGKGKDEVEDECKHEDVDEDEDEDEDEE